MRRTLLAMAALFALGTPPLTAQEITAPATDPARRPASFNSGIKLRFDFHLNRSEVNDVTDAPDDENGYGAGLEINGRHLGIGLYGYAGGQAQEFDSENTPVIIVAEANYFYPIQRLWLAPFVGVHTALGRFTKDYFDDPYFPKPQDSFNDLGYQIGLRFKPIPVLGLDAQWRRVSGYARDNQDAGLSRTQVLLGVTLF